MLCHVGGAYSHINTILVHLVTFTYWLEFRIVEIKTSTPVWLPFGVEARHLVRGPQRDTWVDIFRDFKIGASRLPLIAPPDSYRSRRLRGGTCVGSQSIFLWIISASCLIYNWKSQLLYNKTRSKSFSVSSQPRGPKRRIVKGFNFFKKNSAIIT